MTDHDALAARVRADRDHAHPCDCEHDDCIHDRAYQDAPVYGDLCDAYLDLYDEVKRLRAHVLDQNAEMHKAVQDRAQWQTRCEAAHESEGRLMAERDALRAALAQIAGFEGGYSFPFPESHEEYPSFALLTARAALKGDSDE